MIAKEQMSDIKLEYKQKGRANRQGRQYPPAGEDVRDDSGQ
ncbi:hypothetical protein DGWBC_0327 [Dehalogenimonas sp. WBC-2]|nr:hypothetical protein DGWBC_0327 [Dehalogenimonas sp. WBC-2]